MPATMAGMFDCSDLPAMAWIILAILILVTYSYLSRSPWKRLPPGPPSFPVIGSLPFMSGDIREVFSKMAARYGDVFSVWMGPKHVVVLNGYHTIKQALLKNVFDGRSDLFEDMPGHEFGIIGTDGEIWKTMRRFSLQVMRNFGLGQKSMEDLVNDELLFLMNDLDGICGSAYNPQKPIKKAVANIIAVILFGERYDYHDESFSSFLRDNERHFELSGTNNLAWTFRILTWVPRDPFGYHEVKYILTKWLGFFKEEIQRKKERLHSGDDGGQDFVTLFLKQIPEWQAEKNDIPYEEHLAAALYDMYSAATDTTTSTLQWAILHLTLNPKVQHQLHQEIEAVVGPDRCPSLKDRVNMPYTEAVISETQRLGDIAPLSVPHSTLYDTELKGLVIPKGTMVLPNLNSVHWDPVLWPQPEEFKPERFLDVNGKFRKREELIPFSIGRRSCMGEGLARMELFLFLTSLLQRFSFSNPPDQPLPCTRGVLGLTHYPKAFDVILTAR